MDDGDIDFTNPETYLCPAMGTDPHDSCSISMDSYFHDILKDTETEHLACTHSHTHACCNPLVRNDLAHHTQTCVHVHTKILWEESDDVAQTSESPQETDGPKKQRPPGNRAAVRKYREKKKARTTLLEEEVARLKALNKQLLRRLQSHSALEAEVSRLRCLLVDIRGRIEGELGAFPYQRPVKNNDSADQGSFLGGSGGAQQVRLRCNDPLYCSPEMPATTMDDDDVMSSEVLGQGAGD
uniref:BZIP domain-containing protein n=1 Tax=Triticum urartu TaxID=4572 RepID=A0A8R7R2H4_TRIUA